MMPQMSPGVWRVIEVTARSERRMVLLADSVGIETSAASADPGWAPFGLTARRSHSSWPTFRRT